MKRLLLIVLPLLLMVGCEDNKKSVDPLVGIYNMTSILWCNEFIYRY